MCIRDSVELAGRMRTALEGEPGLTEKKMFGGLAFLVGGHMAISASGQGGVLVHVDPKVGDTQVSRGHAEVAVMRGRPMEGWLRVSAQQLQTKRQLAKWVDLGVGHARTLPPKQASISRK